MGAATETAATITFSCGECSRKIRCPSSFAGKAARCPGCKTAVRAPELVTASKPARKASRPAPEPEVERVRQGPEVDTMKLIGGLGAMAGAAVWFVVGLQNDVIFFYPPVLFLIGVGSVIKACAGGREE